MYDKRSVSLFKCCIYYICTVMCTVYQTCMQNCIQLLYSKIKNIWNIYVLVMKYVYNSKT